MGNKKGSRRICPECGSSTKNDEVFTENPIANGKTYRTCMWCGWYEILDAKGNSLESGKGNAPSIDKTKNTTEEH